MIRTFVIRTAATITLLLPASDFLVDPVHAHGLTPEDSDVFFRRYRGDDEVTDEVRGGGRAIDKDRDTGRAPDRGLESSPGAVKGGDGHSGGNTGGGKNNGYGRPNPNDSDDRFGL